MLRLRVFILAVALWCVGASVASAETWRTTTSAGGVNFVVHLDHPRIVRKVPLVDGVRWDLEVANSVLNKVHKDLTRGPLATVDIEQQKRYVRITARWRFPFAMYPRLESDRFELFIPDTITRTAAVDLARGVSYQRMQRWTLAGPLSVNIVRADLTRAVLRPQIARTERGFSMATVSTMARSAGAIAAVNGSFFSPRGGLPVGLLMLDGQIVSSSFTNRSVFGVRYDGTCFINNAKLRAAVRIDDDRLFIANGVNRPPLHDGIVLYTPHWGSRTRSVPDPSRREFVIAGDGTLVKACLGNAEIPRDGYVLSAQGKAIKALVEQVKIGMRALVYSQLSSEWQGVKYAIGGGPTLVSAGAVKVTAQQERFSDEITQGRAPRTAIGYLGGTSVILVTVDGRQKASVGMTLHELARLMHELGAIEAINLDGGGSTAMVVRGRLVNRPSDGVERAVNNALLVVPS